MLKDLLVNPELRADCHRTDKTKGWAMGKDGMSVYYLPGDTYAAMRTEVEARKLGDGRVIQHWGCFKDNGERVPFRGGSLLEPPGTVLVMCLCPVQSQLSHM